jgi:hypothetical protein
MRLPYSEGDVFLVPLRQGGYARGVVARAGRNGKVLLGYFFGPRLESVDSALDCDLNPANAILRVRFGDLGLIQGEWPILSKVASWNRLDWPMPDFIRRDLMGAKMPVRVRYSESDPNYVEAEHPMTADDDLEPDALYGYGAVEKKLTRLLGASDRHDI